MRLNKAFFAIFFGFFLLGKVFGQSEYSAPRKDAISWFSYEIEKMIGKNALALNTQLRFDDNAKSFSSWINEIDYSRKLSKQIAGGAELRYTYRYSHNNYRYSLFIKHNYNFKAFKLSQKLTFQNSSFYTQNWEEMLRFKSQITYDKTKKTKGKYNNTIWTDPLCIPYAYAEVFYDLNNAPISFNRLRLGFGTTIDLSERNQIKIFYIFQREFNRTIPEINYIYGINFATKL